MRRLLPLLLLLVMVPAAYGQEWNIEIVNGPDGIVNPGVPMTFNASVSGNKPSPIAYDWTVSAGTITEGQGTSSITVDTGGLPPKIGVTATVSVKGIPTACKNSASETGWVIAIGDPTPVDEYGVVPWNEERARLDNLQIMLSNEPGAHLLLMLYLAPKESMQSARKHARKMIGHFLSRDKGFDPALVHFYLFARDRHKTIAYIFPKDATPPADCSEECVTILGSELVRSK